MKFTQADVATCIEDTTLLYESLRSQLLQLPVAEQSKRPTGEWTKQEILGHCCDGGATNLQRIVRAQYEANPPSSVYNQAEWVRIQNYALYEWADLVAYWFLGNKHILHIFNHMPLSAWSNRIIWGQEERSAVWFYHHHFVRHTVGHLAQILPEPIVVPSSIPEFGIDGNWVNG